MACHLEDSNCIRLSKQEVKRRINYASEWTRRGSYQKSKEIRSLAFVRTSQGEVTAELGTELGNDKMQNGLLLLLLVFFLSFFVILRQVLI